MTLSNNKRLTLLIIVVSLIAYLGYTTVIDVNGLLKNKHIVRVAITINDIKAGLNTIQYKTLGTTDKQEVEEIITVFKKPILYKTLPYLGNVPTNPSDRTEMIIVFLLDSNEALEYTITSTGDMKIVRSNGKYISNVNILFGKTKTLFEQLKIFYDSKKQNENWS